MKKLAIVVGTLLLMACATLSDKPRELTAQEMICAETKWEGCMDVPAPIVVVTKLLSPLYWGVYVRGEPYIFVSPNLVGTAQFKRTEVHETVHYLADKLGLERDRCKSEELARRITAKIFNREYKDNWRAKYRCAKPEA